MTVGRKEALKRNLLSLVQLTEQGRVWAAVHDVWLPSEQPAGRERAAVALDTGREMKTTIRKSDDGLCRG